MIWSLINIKYWVVQFHTLNLKPTLRKYFTLVVFLSLMKVMTQFPEVHCDCLLTEWVWEETGAPGENTQTHRENEQTSCRLDVDAVFIIVAGGSHWKSDLKMWLLDFLMSWPHHAGDHLEYYKVTLTHFLSGVHCIWVISWLWLLARLLLIFHPPSFFLSLTRPATLVAHKQKIYQNVRLVLTRYAIIQFSRILIFRDVSREKLQKISHKE